GEAAVPQRGGDTDGELAVGVAHAAGLDAHKALLRLQSAQVAQALHQRLEADVGRGRPRTHRQARPAAVRGADVIDDLWFVSAPTQALERRSHSDAQFVRALQQRHWITCTKRVRALAWTPSSSCRS